MLIIRSLYEIRRRQVYSKLLENGLRNFASDIQILVCLLVFIYRIKKLVKHPIKKSKSFNKCISSLKKGVKIVTISFYAI